MTEEIIIDCAFYKDGVCASPINKTCEYCKNIDVSKCYHKQLKRLEESNRVLQAYKDVNEDFKNAWEELKQKHNDDVEEIAKLGLDVAIIEKERDELKQENEELKSALEEIKKIIKSYDLTVDNGASVDTLYTIGEKINEVIGEN